MRFGLHVATNFLCNRKKCWENHSLQRLKNGDESCYPVSGDYVVNIVESASAVRPN